MTRIVHVVTVPQSLGFFRGQLAYMKAEGFDVEIVCSPGKELDELARREGVVVHALPMAREIRLAVDARALVALTRLLRERRPDIVHAHFPKSGLLGVLAARAARVPTVIYQLRGLRLATSTGVRRAILEAAERTAVRGAHHVIANSYSLRKELLDLGIGRPSKVVVLGRGSSNGVDATKRFRPDAVRPEDARALRAAHGVPDDATVVAFVGRIVRDKGVHELAQAWTDIAARRPNAHLLMVGPEEDQDPVDRWALDALGPERRVHRVGAQKDVAPWYAASDVVVLPTHREGMPNVLLEAGAMAKPVVATKVAGCVDCVVDGVTGTLVPAQDAPALGAALLRYVDDPELRAAHGQAARAHMVESFRPEGLWSLQAAFYRTSSRR